MGTVTIDRSKAIWRDRLRAYKVWIDGKLVGQIRWGESLTLDTEPGSHSCHLTIDWARSQSLTFDGAGTTRFICQAGGSPLNALWAITFGRNRYIRLERG